MRIPRTALLVLAFRLAAPKEAAAQSCPAIELGPILTSGLASPLFATHADDGSHRLFIVEQAGTIRLLRSGASSSTVFLTISGTKILSGGEQGLLGLAFHPDFESNRRFFVYYTRKPDGASVIAEYKASASNPDVADPSPTAATEKVLLTIAQPFSNHNGGMMAFDRNGYLFIASGDGGDGNDPGNRAQNNGVLLGKILRIDVDTPNGQVPYSSPPDNPYWGATAGADEIYAVGVRNPWRMSFDRLTGQLLAGDVGQGQREEVDIIALGGNYGWRVMEGTRCNISGDARPCDSPVFTPPAFEYVHSGGRCSITGGYVYRGEAGTLPGGTYLYGDFCTGEIFGIDVSDLPLEASRLPAAPTLLLDTPLSLASFGEDEAGELYAVGLGGQLQRLLAAVRIAPTRASFGGSGGDGRVAVTSPGGCPSWTAESEASWITITAGSSGDGNGTVGYRVAANPGAQARTGRLSIAGRTLDVEQAAGTTGPRLAIADVRVQEVSGRSTATFAVTLTGPSTETISVKYAAANGTATRADYAPAPGSRLVFQPGTTSLPVRVDIKPDSIDENDEAFRITLSDATHATIADAEGIGTIVDNDPPPAVAIASLSFAEGATVRAVSFTVSLSAASSRTVTVDYVTLPGTATAGTEYRPSSGTLTFSPGRTTKQISFWTKGDLAHEPNETFAVRLQSVVNATLGTRQATATIVDDDPR